MTKTEMMEKIERLTSERDKARIDCFVAENNHAEAVRMLNEAKSAFGGDASEWLLDIIAEEITRCEWERKNVYFVGALKHKIKELREMEKFVRYSRERDGGHK